MREYGCEHSPIRARSADPDDVLDRPSTAAEVRARGVEAFGLAARVQRGLDDAWTAWCLAGGGDGGSRDSGGSSPLRRTGGPQIPPRDGGPVGRVLRFDGGDVPA